ncbi:hypothetical protein AAHA92_13467 [Salvia divinorum]|uniref:Uncharacterized protein n=1 Tax=Salvia divinorum TaxID=28513 RepID=A0ABD1H8E2_SALDI
MSSSAQWDGSTWRGRNALATGIAGARQVGPLCPPQSPHSKLTPNCGCLYKNRTNSPAAGYSSSERDVQPLDAMLGPFVTNSLLECIEELKISIYSLRNPQLFGKERESEGGRT